MSTTTIYLRWVVVENPEGRKMPEWRRSAAIDSEGTIYAPAAISGNEARAMLCALWDGDVGMVKYKEHLFVPTRWLAREYPGIASVCRLIEERVREHFGVTS